MHIAIVANGRLDKTLIPAIRRADYIIGVDRAAYWLLENEVTPDIAVGDFDSTAPEELAAVKNKAPVVQEAPHPKDKTDLEMAAEHAMGLQPAGVVLYGATGTRLDQTLAAVHSLEKFLKAGTNATIRDPNNEATLINSTFKVSKSNSYTYFSVIAHTKKAVVSIRGARYPLDKYTLYRESGLGISNEVTGKQVQIEIHAGMALVIQSKD